MFGTTCFKCVGKRVVLTKRGAAAAGYLKGLRSRTTASLKVGDVINTSFGWATVTALVPAVQEGTSLKGGVMVPYRMEGIDVVTDKVTLCCALPDAMHEARLSQEERRATFASALAFQETLTKAGTPRKSR